MTLLFVAVGVAYAVVVVVSLLIWRADQLDVEARVQRKDADKP